MPLNFLRRKKPDAPKTVAVPTPVARARSGTAFDGLTEEWRLVGRMQIEGRLSDALNKREAVEISGADSALTNRLDAMLSDWAARTSASDKPGYKPKRTDEPTPEEIEQMRALGYVQ